MKRKIAMLICDIDGTLTVKGGKPMAETRRALEYCHDKGILLGLGTGRPVDKRTINRFRQWGLDFEPDVIIGVNGCESWTRTDRKKEKHDLLPKEEVRKILDFMWDLDVNVCVFEDGYDKVLARRLDPVIESSMDRNGSNVLFVDKERFCKYDVVKLEFHYDEDKDEEKIMDLLNKHESSNYSWIKSYKGTLEFMKPGVNKGVTLQRVCEKLDIDLEDVVACGDMDNDAEMLKVAGTGICLANGSLSAREAADYITEKDVEHDGLGDFLFKYIFI